jgi:hypothetical protein
MAQQKVIFDEYIADRFALADLMAARFPPTHLTRSQMKGVFDNVIPVLPAQLTIEMRTPKGRVVVHARGERLLSFSLDHRAKIVWTS